MTEQGTVLVGHYNYFLVVVSVLIAMLSAYAALDLAERVTYAKGRAQLVWLSCGATAMGTGIWSMHYIAMLAFKLPVAVKYDWPTVLASLLAAICASGIGLFAVSRKKMGTLVTHCWQYLHGQWNRGHALHRDGSNAAAGNVLLLVPSRDSVGGIGNCHRFRCSVAGFCFA